MRGEDLPRLDVADGRFASVLARHGFVLLHGLEQTTLERLAHCEHEAASLLRSAHGDERRQGSLHIPERRLRTRAHSACTKKVALPLIGVGVHAVRDAGRLQRIQLHLLTDEAALSLVPWPMRRRPALREAVQRGAADLESVASSLLARLDGGAALEKDRRTQALVDGDPSVLDCFLYPNGHGSLPNMRAHTDPGLLTLTLASHHTGLELLDRASGTWIDVEAMCRPGVDCIVFGGEALQLASGGRYEAAVHRVRHGAQPRVSVVYEMRIGSVTPPSGSSSRCLSTQAERIGLGLGHAAQKAEAEEAEAATEADGRAYCVCFARERLGRGSTPVGILREFGAPDDTWPVSGASPTTSEAQAETLGALIFDWVGACREREAAAAAFANAEYVEVTPAFADCTGRFVDIHFSSGHDSDSAVQS